MQFMAKDLEGKTFGNQVKRLLYDLIMSAKEVGNRVRLLPWRNTSSMKPISGPEMNLIGEIAILDYIKTPRGFNLLMNKKNTFNLD